MPSLRRNLEWFFVVIAVLGLALLVWGLFSQWSEIRARHELRQRNQVTTVANATHEVLKSQEIVMAQLGAQLVMHWRIGQVQAIPSMFESMLGINDSALGYLLFDSRGEEVAARWREHLRGSESVPDDLSAVAGCNIAVDIDSMVVGKPFLISSTGHWVMPLCKALRIDPDEVAGYMVTVLNLEGDDSFFDRQATLGPTNILQVVREADLSSILWATPLDLPDDYLAQSISRSMYERAISSAESLSGRSFDELRASGQPYPYDATTALGQQVGMAVYDSRYRFWVLTQNNRSELTAQLWRTGWLYGAIYFVVLAGLFAVLVAIARAERRRRSDLVYQANHDMLTGLPNRQCMARDFERLHRRYRGQFSMMFVDMNNFKAVNDGFGHVQGDALLRILGTRLREFATGNERVARVGGDEFVLLTPETSSQRLLERSEALVKCLSDRYVVDGLRFDLGCSIGIAKTSDAGESLNEVLRAADVAMYAAKRERNVARLFEPAMGRVYLENIQIEQHLHDAVESRDIHLAYQPQVDADGRIVGVEALARWRSPDLGEIAPERFIAIAEASGLIGKVGDLIVERALADAAVIASSAGRRLRFSINVSVRQFLQPGFSDHLIDQVRSAGLNDMQPVLEITENLFIEDYETVVGEVRSIRDAGIRISLDDFGTGFSSLAVLRSLPVDELKIDKSFIEHIDQDGGSRKMVQSIMTIGRNLDLMLIAEGIEAQAQFDWLRDSGCDVYQGYLFARPMPLQELVEALRKQE